MLGIRGKYAGGVSGPKSVKGLENARLSDPTSY